MAYGEEKLRAKFAGAFVSLRGLLGMLWVSWQVLSSTSGAGTLMMFNFVLAFATFFAGIGVLMASKKGYFAATFLTGVSLIASGSLLGIALELSIFGALWKGWKIQIREDYDAAESVGRNY